MATIRVGLIGFGLSGTVFHTPFFGEGSGYELVAIVTSRHANAQRACPGVTVFASLDELLAFNQFDVAVITTPNHLHYVHAKACLLAGKHVVVEKPFVTTSQEGRELVGLAKDQGVVLTVFHNRRWDGDYLTIKGLIEQNVLGDLLHFESHFDRFRPAVDQRWKEQSLSGNGSFFDLGSHLIDQAMMLFGRPERILADIGTQRLGAVADDYFHVVMTYGRLRVILHGGSVMAKPAPRFQLHGTKGSFIKHGLDPQESMLKAGQRPGMETWGKDDPDHYGTLTLISEGHAQDSAIETSVGCYESFYKELFQAIRTGKAPPVLASEALRVVDVIEQCKRMTASK